MINNKKIIAVLPAYNAAKTLKMTLDAIPRDVVDDVLLVDDASSDNTVEVARMLGIKTFVHPKNRGYGGNQKTCYQEALKLEADIAVMVHPDFQYDPKFIPELVRPIAEGAFDAVFGSRMLDHKSALKGGMPYWKFVANIFLTVLENTVLGMKLTEYHSGFRAYSKNVLKTLPIELNSDDFVFDTEIIVQMKTAGFRIKEIPISTRYFPEASMIGFARSIKYGLSILLIMARYILHSYRLRHYSQFGNFPTKYKCSFCMSRFSRLLFPGNQLLNRALQEQYRITDEKSGAHDDIYECLRCGLAYVPQSQEQETKSMLERYYANSSLDAVYVNDASGRMKTAGRILETIEKIRKVSGGTLLDFGCNAGLFLKEAQKRNYKIYGIELSAAAIQYARVAFGITTIQRGFDAPLQEFPDNFFDVITAFDVLEHLQNPKTIFDCIYDKLCPGGIFVFTAPNIKSFYARLSGNHWHALVPAHLSYFSPRFIRHLEKTSKFELVYQRSYLRYFSFAYILQRLLKNNAFSLPAIFRHNVPVNLFDELEVCFRKKI